MKNMTIMAKLIMIFVTLFTLSLVTGVVGIVAMMDTHRNYQGIMYGANLRTNLTTEMQFNNATIRRMLVEIGSDPLNAPLVNERYNEVREVLAGLHNLIEEYNYSVANDQSLTDDDRAVNFGLSSDMTALLISLEQQILQKVDLARGGQVDALSQAMEEYRAFSDVIRDQGILLRDLSANRAATLSAENFEFVFMIRAILITTLVISLLFFIALAVIAIASVKKPISEMEKKAKQIADGDFSIDMRSNKRDEISALSNVIADTIRPFTQLISNLENMASEVNDGNTSSRIDEKNYKGDYKRAVVTINKTIDNLVEDNIKALNIVEEYGDGNFEAKLEKLPGERAIANKIVGQLQSNLKNVDSQITSLITSIEKGDLSVVLDSSKYRGSWKGLINGLNNVVSGLVAPINESSEVMSQVVKGNFSVRMTGDYKGDLTVIKNSINTTVTNLQDYIVEINSILGKVASKDLTKSIDREYLGEFIEVRASINEIVNSFNKVMSEIDSSSIQIATGVTQVSQSSISLAQGAAEQSNAVESLNSNISQITSQIQHSAKNAIETSKLALSAKESADVGNRDMKNMLVSMEEINKASENISKIIKVIDDIAFQTNLLALNAAVEAARAGEHGKGFAVVAEEVRALAQRSKSAAAETNELIEASMEKTTAGSAIANKTAEALDTIVHQISEISELIEDVAKASTEQTLSIDQINKGIEQIAVVTQSNTATSEESASVSEELSSQTETFRNMVDEFNLRK